MRTRVVLASLLVLALSIISATFTLLATTSKSWGTQAYYYDNGTELGLTEITPACTLERSPFYRCGLPRVDINGTCNITDCAYYKPYGTNRTSCRSAHEFGRIWSENSLAMGLLGMSQECQEGKSLSEISILLLPYRLLTRKIDSFLCWQSTNCCLRFPCPRSLFHAGFDFFHCHRSYVS